MSITIALVAVAAVLLAFNAWVPGDEDEPKKSCHMPNGTMVDHGDTVCLRDPDGSSFLWRCNDGRWEKTPTPCSNPVDNAPPAE